MLAEIVLGFLFFFTHHITELSTQETYSVVFVCGPLPILHSVCAKELKLFFYGISHFLIHIMQHLYDLFGRRKSMTPCLDSTQVVAVFFHIEIHSFQKNRSYVLEQIKVVMDHRSNQHVKISITKTFFSCVWVHVQYIKVGSNYCMTCTQFLLMEYWFCLPGNKVLTLSYCHVI